MRNKLSPYYKLLNETLEDEDFGDVSSFDEPLGQPGQRIRITATTEDEGFISMYGDDHIGATGEILEEYENEQDDDDRWFMILLDDDSRVILPRRWFTIEEDSGDISNFETPIQAAREDMYGSAEEPEGLERGPYFNESVEEDDSGGDVTEFTAPTEDPDREFVNSYTTKQVADFIGKAMRALNISKRNTTEFWQFSPPDEEFKTPLGMIYINGEGDAYTNDGVSSSFIGNVIDGTLEIGEYRRYLKEDVDEEDEGDVSDFEAPNLSTYRGEVRVADIVAAYRAEQTDEDIKSFTVRYLLDHISMEDFVEYRRNRDELQQLFKAVAKELKLHESVEEDEDAGDVSNFQTPMGLVGQRVQIDIEPTHRNDFNIKGLQGMYGTISRTEGSLESQNDDSRLVITLDNSESWSFPRSWVKLIESVDEEEGPGDVSGLPEPGSRYDQAVRTLKENGYDAEVLYMPPKNSRSGYHYAYVKYVRSPGDLRDLLSSEGYSIYGFDQQSVFLEGEGWRFHCVFALKDPDKPDRYIESSLIGRIADWKTLSGESHRGPIVELDGNVAYVDCEICGKRIAVEDGAYDFDNSLKEEVRSKVKITDPKFMKAFYRVYLENSRYGLKDLEGFPEGLDLENCDIVSLGKDHIQFSAGGDWQNPVSFSLVVSAQGEPRIADLYSSICKTPKKEISAYVKQVEALMSKKLKENEEDEDFGDVRAFNILPINTHVRIQAPSKEEAQNNWHIEGKEGWIYEYEEREYSDTPYYHIASKPRSQGPRQHVASVPANWLIKLDDVKEEKRMATYKDVLRETRRYENAEDIAQDLSQMQGQPVESEIPPPPDAAPTPAPAPTPAAQPNNQEQQVQALFTKYYPTMGTPGAVQQISTDLKLPYAAAHAMVSHYLSQFTESGYDKDWSIPLPGETVNLVSTEMAPLDKPGVNILAGNTPDIHADSEFDLPEYTKLGAYRKRKPYGESIEEVENEGDVAGFPGPPFPVEDMRAIYDTLVEINDFRNEISCLEGDDEDRAWRYERLVASIAHEEDFLKKEYNLTRKEAQELVQKYRGVIRENVEDEVEGHGDVSGFAPPHYESGDRVKISIPQELFSALDADTQRLNGRSGVIQDHEPADENHTGEERVLVLIGETNGRFEWLPMDWIQFLDPLEESTQEEEDFGDVSDYEKPGWRTYYVDYVLYGHNGNEYHHAKFAAPDDVEALAAVVTGFTGSEEWKDDFEGYDEDTLEDLLNEFSNSDMDIIEIYPVDRDVRIYVGAGDQGSFDDSEDTMEDEDWDDEDE